MTHQHYTEEFRKEAAKCLEKPGITQAQVAQELGNSAHMLMCLLDR